MSNLTEQPTWHRSCASGTCVEVAKVAGRFLIRDSKHPDVPPLSFTEQEWQEFVCGIKKDAFPF